MNIQIFGKNKCFDTRKAERYFKERRISFQSIDLKRYGMSGKEFDSVLRAVGGIDQLIDWYFTEGCDADTRLKIYCYVALGGLLWSNWCEYENPCSPQRKTGDSWVLPGNMGDMGIKTGLRKQQLPKRYCCFFKF